MIKFLSGDFISQFGRKKSKEHKIEYALISIDPMNPMVAVQWVFTHRSLETKKSVHLQTVA